MQVSNYIVIAALEACFLLVLICLFLALHIRTQRKLIRLQYDKLQGIAPSQGSGKDQQSIHPFLSTTEAYRNHIARQLEETRMQYQSIAPVDDISSPAPDAPLSQKTLALRHHFLLAESIAVTFSDNRPVIRWDYLEQELSRLLPPSVNTEALEIELSNSKKRIENLENFKQLFFELEQQWQAAQENAQIYYQELSALTQETNDKAYVSDLLDRYHSVYNDVSHSMAIGRTNLEKNPSVIYKAINTTRTDPNATTEIIKLHNVAVEQHRIINQLQRRLEEATTAADREMAMQDLQHQLQRQVRFAQEAETCVKLIEDELKGSQEKLHQQEQQLQQAAFAQEENQRMKGLLHSFVLESKTFMATIIKLEQENEALKQELLEEGKKIHDKATKTIQTNYLTLQTQYAELEEKYLELKRKP